MTYLDVFLFVILFASTVIGLYKGFVREAGSLMTLVLAFVAAFYFAAYPLWWLPPEWLAPAWTYSRWTVTAEHVAYGVSFVVILLLTAALGGAVARRLGRLANDGALGGLNRVFGGLFGLARGVVVVVLSVMLLGATRIAELPWWYDAKLLPPFEAAAAYVVSMLPPQYIGFFGDPRVSP